MWDLQKFQKFENLSCLPNLIFIFLDKAKHLLSFDILFMPKKKWYRLTKHYQVFPKWWKKRCRLTKYYQNGEKKGCRLTKYYQNGEKKGCHLTKYYQNDEKIRVSSNQVLPSIILCNKNAMLLIRVLPRGCFLTTFTPCNLCLCTFYELICWYYTYCISF